MAVQPRITSQPFIPGSQLNTGIFPDISIYRPNTFSDLKGSAHPFAVFQEALGPIQPKSEAQTKAEDPRRSLHQLKLIKTIVGGLAVGSIGSFLFNVPWLLLVGTEAISGLIESLFVDKAINGQSPFSRTMIGLSNRLVGGPNKPLDQLTEAEKKRCIAPISGLITGISALLTATVGYLKAASNKKAHLHGPHGGKPVDVLLLRQQLKEATGLFKPLALRIKLIANEMAQSSSLKWIRSKPLVGFAGTVLIGLIVGWGEGAIANRLSDK